MDLNLTLMQTFYTVARGGSYSSASRSLGLSYQTAANHVRRLEQLVGGTLVETEQGSRQIRLTPRGRRLYNLLQPELDSMLQRLTLILGLERPAIRLGLPAAFFYYLMPRILSKFSQLHPSVQIQAFERDTMLTELIKSGGLDVCISERFLGDSDIPQHLIGDYSLCIIVPKSWDSSLTIDNIADWGSNNPFVTYEPGQVLRNAAARFLADSGVDHTIAISASSGLSVKRCVETGLGYSIVPEWILREREPLLRKIEVPDLARIKLYYGHSKFLSDNVYVQDLHEICQAEIKEPFGQL